MFIIRKVENSEDYEVFGTRRNKIYFNGSEESCKKYIKNKKAAYQRKLKDDIMESCGLVKVKSISGKIYYE